MIRFGTAGWRGVIGDEFTFRNVRLVAQGIADSIEANGVVVVGHDTRFLSERFAIEVARVLAHNGHRVLRTTRDVPSPTLSFAVAANGATAGVTITGSHCPPEYNGLKLYAAGGVPAPPEMTGAVEARIAEIEATFVDRYSAPGEFATLDPTEPYLAAVGQLVDLEAVARSGIRIALDPLFGTAHEILDRLLLEAGCECMTLHNFRDAYFDGYSPAFSDETLVPLRERVAGGDFAVGLATDTDADRFAVIDRDGRVLDAHDAHALLLDDLLGRGRATGPVARSVATSHLIDRVAARHDSRVLETPCGFRHLGRLLHSGEASLAVEESAGFGWSRHLPDKDGILACLLIAELCARHDQSLADLALALRARVGDSAHLRRDYPLDERLEARMARLEERLPTRLGARGVQEAVTTDGFKLDFGESWFLVRRSGTKPVLRCYAEAPTRTEAEALHGDGHRLLFATSEGH